MKLLGIFLGIASVQSCQKFHENSQGNNFLVTSFDAESSLTSLEELGDLMQQDRDFLVFPRILSWLQFTGFSASSLNKSGFCDGEESLEIILFTIHTNETVRAAFYGCCLHSIRNVKIIVIDELTRNKGIDQFKDETINWKFNSTFCKCKEDYERIKNCDLEEKSELLEFNTVLALLVAAFYIAILLIVIYASRMSNRVSTIA